MKLFKKLADTAVAHVVADFTTGQLRRSTKMGLVAGAVGYVALFGLSTEALATATVLNDTLSNTVKNTNKMADAIAYGSYIMGTGFSVLGLLDVKKHVDNPAQNPLKNGLGKLGIGGLLFALPYVTNTALRTTGGAADDRAFDSLGTAPTI